MEHRSFLPHREAQRPFVGSDLLERIGGRATLDTLIDGLYRRIETDPALRPLFGRNLEGEREAQKRFFCEWLGGDAVYSARAHLPLKHRHDLLPITAALAQRWLEHFEASLERAVSEGLARRLILENVRQFAFSLVNEGEQISALRAHPHGTCLRYEPASASLGLARRGDVSQLQQLLERAPDVLSSAPHAAHLLQLATLNGRISTVELLLDHGVDVNRPSPIEPLILVSALCAARARGRKAIESLLLERGAREDIFTHAFLGDLSRLELDLTSDPASAQASDPAVDALEITPLHHAVAGERPAALSLLLRAASARGARILGSGRALRDAATRENVALVRLLLEHGASGAGIGAGRWVLHPELAPLLTRAGASVERNGAWIGLSCTGNQGRKDDPEYVKALLAHGARVDDKRLSGQGNDGGQATALHYAAKAGFVKSIAVLLDAGADPSAPDDNGLTPLDWLERATKSVDRAQVRRLLLNK